MSTQIKPSPSATEVLRFIKEEALIQKIKDSGLLALDDQNEDEYDNTLFDLFAYYHEDASISDWDSFTKELLHNGTKEAREELKYVQFELYDVEVDNDYDMYEETRELTINDSFLMRGY